MVTLALKENIKLQEEPGHADLFFSLFQFKASWQTGSAGKEPRFGNTQLPLEIEEDRV